MSTPDIITIDSQGCLLSIDTKETVPRLFSIPVPKCIRLNIVNSGGVPLVVLKEESVTKILPKPTNVKSKNRKCTFEGGCDKCASYGDPDSKTRERCSKHKIPGMIDVIHKKCQHPGGCNKRPSYNLPDESKGIYCFKHKLEGMVDVISERCQENGCNTQPCFNFPEYTRGVYCVKHKLEGMINVQCKTCLEDDCSIQPLYNLPSESGGIYCLKHKKEGMIDVVTKDCHELGCTTTPNFNFPGETEKIYCKKHKQEGMVAITRSYCQETGCEICPKFNFPGEHKGIYCLKHKCDGMVAVARPHCQETGCEIRPNFNLPGEHKGIYCLKHKRDGMINVIDKICQVEDCGIIVQFGKLFGPKVHCATHRSQNEYRDNHPKCSSPNCPERPLYTDQRDNYPLRCENHHFPQDKNVIERPCAGCKLLNFINEDTMMCNDCSAFFVGKNNRGEKERRVREVIETQVHKPLGLTFLVVNRPVPDGCSRKRPDTATDYSHSIEIVETDENQHRAYANDCEVARMGIIHQDFGGIPVIFIRYNPDSYMTNGTRYHKNQNREQVLVDLMLSLKNVKIVKYPLLVCYLFYDGFDGNIKFSSIDYTKNPIEIKEVTDMFE